MYSDNSLYRQISNSNDTVTANTIVDHSDVVGAWSTYIFIPDLTPGFNGLGKENCKTRREAIQFWDHVWIILEVHFVFGGTSSFFLGARWQIGWYAWGTKLNLVAVGFKLFCLAGLQYESISSLKLKLAVNQYALIKIHISISICRILHFMEYANSEYYIPITVCYTNIRANLQNITAIPPQSDEPKIFPSISKHIITYIYQQIRNNCWIFTFSGAVYICLP